MGKATKKDRRTEITKVGSHTKPEEQYDVHWNHDRLRLECSCPSFRFNKNRTHDGCKHLRDLMGVVAKLSSCLTEAKDDDGRLSLVA